jgi:bifunctional DNA-binding transcriptional regulator/antitoxin component of YhaV-PrlF toxin-antitoxin module
MSPRVVCVADQQTVAVATVSTGGLVHLPKAVQETLGLKKGEKIVFFVDAAREIAYLVSESQGFQFPEGVPR